MEELEDEDVFPEHSQLFHYLQECELPRQIEVDNSKPKKYSFRLNDSWVAVKILMSHIKNYFWTLFRTVYNHEKLEEHYLNKHGEVILNSCVLVEEDAAFLENFFLHHVSLAEEPDHIALFRLKSLIPYLPVLMSYIGLKWQHHFVLPEDSYHLKNIINTILYGGTCFVVCHFSLNFAMWRKKRNYSKSLSTLNQFIKHCEKFSQNVRKCLTNIQEMEVIGRGMLLYPLRKEIDKPNHYIAFIEEETIGPLLTVNIDDDEEVSSATDNLSISAIKSLCQLLNVQLSEMLRRLALCFFPEPFLKPQNSAAKKHPCWIVSSIIKPLNKKLNDATLEINDCFTLETKISKAGLNQSKRRSQASCGPYSLHDALKTSLRSLARHAEVSLARIQEFLEIMQDPNDSIYDSPFDEERFSAEKFKILNEHLESIRDDIEACKTCWEESSLRLIKLFNRSDEDIAEFSESTPQIDSHSPKYIIQMHERTDIAPADQVFEAYIDKNDYSFETDDGDITDVGFTLKKKTLEEKRISQNVFEELKTVLKPRAKEWEERETKALGITPSSDKINAAQSSDDESMLSAKNRTPSLSLLSSYPNLDDKSESKETEAKVLNSNDTIKHELLNTFESSPNISIANLVAQHSRMLNLSTCQEGSVFAFDGSDSSDGDSSNTEDS